MLTFYDMAKRYPSPRFFFLGQVSHIHTYTHTHTHTPHTHTHTHICTQNHVCSQYLTQCDNPTIPLTPIPCIPLSQQKSALPIFNSVLLCTLDLWRHDQVPRGGILLNPNLSKCKGRKDFFLSNNILLTIRSFLD